MTMAVGGGFGLGDWIRWGLTLAATIALGIGAWKIASRQAYTARMKLKLDLFERRHDIYKATVRFCRDVANDGPGSAPVINFADAVDQAWFLFGDDIHDHMQKLLSTHTELWSLKVRGEHPDLAEAEIVANGNRGMELTMFFVGQVQTQLAREFRPYLHFPRDL